MGDQVCSGQSGAMAANPKSRNGKHQVWNEKAWPKRVQVPENAPASLAWSTKSRSKEGYSVRMWLQALKYTIRSPSRAATAPVVRYSVSFIVAYSLFVDPQIPMSRY